MAFGGGVNFAIVRVTLIGQVHTLDTSSFVVGEMVWVDPLNPGKLTNVMPVAPNNIIGVGNVVTVSATVGVVQVNLHEF